MDLAKFKRLLSNNKFSRPMYNATKKVVNKATFTYEIQELLSIGYREENNQKLRINLIVPSLNKEHVFGGIATALDFFKQLGVELDCDMRIIITDSYYDKENAVNLDKFEVTDADLESKYNKQIIPFGDRYNKTIPVSQNDLFVATAWWTAYNVAEIIRWQNNRFNINNKLIYFIQDYEPGFYPWSSRYVLADSTYKMDIDTIAVINSKELNDYFVFNDYKFYRKYYFDVSINSELYKHLIDKKELVMRKNQILIYGRPSVQRNAFEVILAGLKEWSINYEKSGEWEIISLGENFGQIDLTTKNKIKSYGKVSLEKYAQIMLESRIGISLMISPHPSYPPLEMSTFGVKTITNQYDNKELSYFNDNIISISNCSQFSIAKKITELCEDKSDYNIYENTEYCENTKGFKDILDNLIIEINQ